MGRARQCPAAATEIGDIETESGYEPGTEAGESGGGGIAARKASGSVRLPRAPVPSLSMSATAESDPQSPGIPRPGIMHGVDVWEFGRVWAWVYAEA